MYDIIIIGAGPAGLAAATYCLNKRMEVLVIAPDLGGKADYRLHLAGLEGFEHITGEEIVRKFRSQLQYLQTFAHVRDTVKQVEVKAGAEHETTEYSQTFAEYSQTFAEYSQTFAVTTEAGKHFPARSIILATGVEPIRLNVAGEERALGRGLSYSAISHASLFWERETAVVGSGNLALRSAAELASTAKRVVLVAPEGLGDSPLKRKLAAMDNVTILEKHTVRRLHTNGYLHGITIFDPAGHEQEVPVSGVFVELGLIPQSEAVKGCVDLDQDGYVVVDDRCRTSRPGIFAAGDVTNTYGEQVLIATGEGVKAALAAYDYLLGLES